MIISSTTSQASERAEPAAGLDATGLRQALEAAGRVKVATYDWGEEDSHLSPPFDLIIVSDCILPKLYPIEPLVKVLRSFQPNLFRTPSPWDMSSLVHPRPIRPSPARPQTISDILHSSLASPSAPYDGRMGRMGRLASCSMGWQALANLSGPDTTILVSYEHRVYQHFDPRLHFQGLARSASFPRSKSQAVQEK